VPRQNTNSNFLEFISSSRGRATSNYCNNTFCHKAFDQVIL